MTNFMFPDKCSIKEGKNCVNAPEFVISIVSGNDEYMVCVACNRHKNAVFDKIRNLQDKGKIPNGKINFSSLKPVGTDCITGNDLIQI